MNVVKLREVGRVGFHAASLLFTAWGLVATSAPDPDSVPTVDCFTGIAPNASVQLTLTPAGDGGETGTLAEADAGPEASAEVDAEAGSVAEASSVAEAGSVAEGGTLAEAEVDAEAPLDAGPLCVSTSTTNPCVSSCNGIDGLGPGRLLVLDVAYTPGQQAPSLACTAYETNAIQGVTGVTLSNQAQSNGGAFTIASGTFTSSVFLSCGGQWSLTLEPVTPAVPGGNLVPVEASAGWQVVRTIFFNQVQFCGDAFRARGPLRCQDTFAVSAIAGGDQ
ncbi:MAG TPA: hypothetical protein VK841_24785 [Polyangiaceae bacterium]|jgi:hypothetical protein|nr:hypothetical protein [Polyangiaceae bacterium]